MQFFRLFLNPTMKDGPKFSAKLGSKYRVFFFFELIFYCENTNVTYVVSITFNMNHLNCKEDLYPKNLCGPPSSTNIHARICKVGKMEFNAVKDACEMHVSMWPNPCPLNYI